MTSERLVYDIAEAVKVTKLSRTTLYRLIRDGKLATKKIGARVLIPREAVEGLLK